MTKAKKASVSEETFDEFLAEQGLLERCEDHAIKELIAEQQFTIQHRDLEAMPNEELVEVLKQLDALGLLPSEES